jgi:hypothetical protein
MNELLTILTVALTLIIIASLYTLTSPRPGDRW